MIQIRRGTVVDARASRDGVTELVVDVDGARAEAISYDDLTGAAEVGDRVVLNTTAVALGLGTGGIHFVMAVEGRERSGPVSGHAMKLRYTPVQSAVDAVEQTHAEALDSLTSLAGRPIVVPRISFADARERHRGLSHHTVTALSLALARADVALPPLEKSRSDEVRARIDAAGLAARHDFIEVDLGTAERALESSLVPL